MAALAIAAGLKVAPVPSAPAVELMPVLSAEAFSTLVKPARSAAPQAETRLTARAVPLPKPRIEAPAPVETTAALFVPPPTPPLPGTSGSQRPAPSGYLDFCRRRPDICTVGGASQAALSDAKWDELVTVNTHYDETIEPRTDMEALGVVEHWDIPQGRHPVGDCEDFALSKKAQLIAMGWPRSALLLAVGNIPGADPASRRHAVLIVVTDRGNFVLDNRRLKILPWDEAGYDWVSIQSPADAYKWVAIDKDERSKLVTASGVPDIVR